MKSRISLLILAALAIFPSFPLRAEPVLRDFVRADGGQLTEAGQPFRFISFDVPNLLMIEDNFPFAGKNPWRLPDRFEITDALQSVRQAGGTVARTYVVTVARTNDPPDTPRHVLGPGKFNEQAFRTVDATLQVANETGVRLVIPFVDNWGAMGGRGEYAAWRGKSKDAFWTDPQIIADFEQTIHFILTRTNTLTGMPYRDDKAILCWETGNELQCPVAWTRQIAAYIKSLDTNHLVMDGFYTTTKLRLESLTIPEVDIVSSHHYPSRTDPTTFADYVRMNAAMARGKKAYVVGEFGFVSTAEISNMLNEVIQTGAAGAMAWSLRFRDRDGGFYWHSEQSGGNQYKAFHWPGFATGADYDEQNLLTLMRQKAFEIRGLPLPEIPVPAPPKLLPISNAAAISWQGPVGATSYAVERAASKNGPWTIIADNMDETAVQYRPLFADTNVERGKWFYRVSARNQSGVSAPSNVVGPVRVNHATVVDEMADFSLMSDHSGPLEVRTHDCRRVKEDIRRVAGEAGSAIVYRVGGKILACRLYTFFPDQIADFKFYISADGEKFAEVPGTKRNYFTGSREYGFWKPVLYECKSSDPTARILKIEFQGLAQIGRTEIQYR